MKLAVIVPSRGRPQAMAELLEVFDKTCRADTRIICRVDDDDPTLDGYRQTVPYHLYVGARIGLGPSINEMADDFVNDFDVLGFMGDDHRPRTVGWDERVLWEIDNEPLAVVYGDDLLQGRRLATQVFMSSHLVRKIGYFCPPGVQHMYLDNFWMELGKALGSLTFLEDVIIEHMHPIAKKADWDAGYAEVNSQERYNADFQAYSTFMQHQFKHMLIDVLS